MGCSYCHEQASKKLPEPHHVHHGVNSVGVSSGSKDSWQVWAERLRRFFQSNDTSGGYPRVCLADARVGRIAPTEPD